MKRALALAMVGLAAPAHAAPGPFTYQCKAPFWEPAGLWQINAGRLRSASGQITVNELQEIPADWRPERELRPAGPVPDMRGALGADVEFRAECQGGEFMFHELDWSR